MKERGAKRTARDEAAADDHTRKRAALQMIWVRADRKTSRPTDRPEDPQADRPTVRRTNRPTDPQTDRLTD